VRAGEPYHAAFNPKSEDEVLSSGQLLETTEAPDKAVPREIRSLLSGERLKLRETGRRETLRSHGLAAWRSGAARLAGRAALSDGRHHLQLFRRFTMGNVQRLFEPLKSWELDRLPLRLTATVSISTRRVRAVRRAGRLAEKAQPAQGWTAQPSPVARDTGGGSLCSPRMAPQWQLRHQPRSSGFLEEALALWQQRQKIRLVRADSGFFDDRLSTFLEQRCLPCIVVTRLTQWVKREAQRIEQWTVVDDEYAVGEFQLRLHNWIPPLRRCPRAYSREAQKCRSQADRRARLYVPDLRTSCTAAPMAFV
jgi:hypothetical protein